MYRGDEIFQREAAAAQTRGIGEEVVLLLVAAEIDDVGDAGHPHEVLLDDPILPASELTRAVAVALQRVLVDLTDGCVIRSQGRRHSLRDFRSGEPLGDLLAGKVDVHPILEGDDDL